MVTAMENLLKRRGAEVRYLVSVALLAGLFSQFVACGSEFYKVSMEGDHETAEPSRLASQNGDPTSQWYGIHAARGWERYPIDVIFSKDLNSVKIAGLKRAFEIWSQAAGKQLFRTLDERTSISGNGFRDLSESLQQNFNGIYLTNNWSATGKSSSVLATTNWYYNSAAPDYLKQAAITYNLTNYDFCDSQTLEGCATNSTTTVTADVTTVSLHEVGHFLGLSHVKDDKSSIMNESLYVGKYMAQRYLSVGDIRRIRTIIPCNDCDGAEVTAARIQQDDPSLKRSTLALEE